MPKHHTWLQPVTIGNAERRKRDRQRKSNSRSATVQHIPRLADYETIDRRVYKQLDIGGHLISYLRVCDIARIFGLAPATVQRWFDLGMLPYPAQWEIFGCTGRTVYANTENIRKRPLFSKQQVFVICATLNNLFEQGYRQFRQSHAHHIEMMQVGCDIAMQRLSIKLAKPPKQRLPILPSPQQRKSRAETSKLYSYNAYRPTDYKEWLLSL